MCKRYGMVLSEHIMISLKHFNLDVIRAYMATLRCAILTSPCLLLPANDTSLVFYYFDNTNRSYSVVPEVPKA